MTTQPSINVHLELQPGDSLLVEVGSIKDVFHRDVGPVLLAAFIWKHGVERMNAILVAMDWYICPDLEKDYLIDHEVEPWG